MSAPHDHLSYYGFMFDVRAVRRDVVITSIKMGSTYEDTYSYRVFVSTEPHDMISQRKEYWAEVGEGKCQLPEDAGSYLAVPLHQQIKIQAGQTRAIYVHCDNAEGVAYRYGVDAEQDGVTDRDEDLEILSGIASFSMAPFEDMYDVPRSFAGIIEYVV